MTGFKKFLRFDFVPASADLGLLLLRLWLGAAMFALHGLGKLKNFGATVTTFQEKMGIPSVFGAGAVIAESVCAILLVLGLATRWSALFLALTMAVAFVVGHGASLTPGPGSGELAFIYLAGFLALVLGGGGKWSLDRTVLRA